jgi:hypothetical protein
MRTHRAYLFGVGLALPILALVAGLQVRTVAASPQKMTTDVNRSLKGDRLPDMVPGPDRRPAKLQGWQAQPASPKLPDGCEATVSAMTRSSLARTPGRCIS